MLSPPSIQALAVGTVANNHHAAAAHSGAKKGRLRVPVFISMRMVTEERHVTTGNRRKFVGIFKFVGLRAVDELMGNKSVDFTEADKINKFVVRRPRWVLAALLRLRLRIRQEQAQALLLSSVSAAAGDKACQLYNNNCAPAPGVVASAAQSELTCNGGGVALPSRKRGREHADLEPQAPTPSPGVALLPIPATHTHRPVIGADRQDESSSATASTRGRPVSGSSAADALVAELFRQGCAEECGPCAAGCAPGSSGPASGSARRWRPLREKEAALEAARRRAVGLEETLRRAAAERQAWRGLARGNEAAASGLRATLDALLLRGADAAPAEEVEEGFGDSGHAADDAASCCFVDREEDARGASAPAPAARRWACRACGAGEATVLVLPCRHLCLCKVCEPRVDACPVCLAAKNASIHVAAATHESQHRRLGFGGDLGE
ncbi:hypothetical protein U9M48_002515 [Paspalum notatum var. saurae]|uniref:RING-type domain-containing protein n=1 Tax=Paspalum notatum var. saurae TaxID=547442 RepID=A0AAQ3SJV7_PASNO